MIPSAVPRNIARVLPLRAAASTHTKRPVRFPGGTCDSSRSTRALLASSSVFATRPDAARRQRSGRSALPARHCRASTSNPESSATTISPRAARLYSSAFFRGVLFEGLAVFDGRGQRCEIGNPGDLNAVHLRCTGEVAQFSGIRSCDQHASHCVRPETPGFGLLASARARDSAIQEPEQNHDESHAEIHCACCPVPGSHKSDLHPVQARLHGDKYLACTLADRRGMARPLTSTFHAG